MSRITISRLQQAFSTTSLTVTVHFTVFYGIECSTYIHQFTTHVLTTLRDINLRTVKHKCFDYERMLQLFLKAVFDCGANFEYLPNYILLMCIFLLFSFTLLLFFILIATLLFNCLISFLLSQILFWLSGYCTVPYHIMTDGRWQQVSCHLSLLFTRYLVETGFSKRRKGVRLQYNVDYGALKA